MGETDIHRCYSVGLMVPLPLIRSSFVILLSSSETQTDSDAERGSDMAAHGEIERLSTQEAAGHQEAQAGNEEPLGGKGEDTLNQSRMEGDDEIGRMCLISDKAYFRDYLQVGAGH